MSDLAHKESKINVIKMLNNLKRIISKLIENFHKNIPK